jgi:hypothetical protein
MAIYKNTSKRIAFGSLTTAGAANTATTPTVTVSLDGAAPTTATNTPTHLGSGQWTIVLTAAEMNADLVAVTATGTGLVPAYREFYTEADWTSAKAGFLDAAISGVAAAVWAAGTRTLTSFGTLAADVWAAATRTITGGTIGTYTGNTPQTGDAFVRLGAPAGASHAADVAAVKADTGGLRTDYTTARAGKLDNLDQPVGTRSTYAGGAVASVTGAVGSVSGDVGGKVLGGGAAVIAGDGVRAASVTADVGITQAGADRVWASTARTLTAFTFSVTASAVTDKAGYTLAVAPPTAADIDTQLSGSHGAGAWDAVGAGGGGGLTITDVQTAMTNQGYTTVRAGLLDNADIATSTRLADADYTAPTAFPTDYQQRGVAVTLPAAPAGYGGAPADVIVSALLSSPVTFRDVTSVTAPTVMDALAAAVVEAAGAESVLNRAYVKLTPTGGVFRTFTLTTAPGDQARS